MATPLISVGNTDVASTPFTLAAGEEAFIFLTGYVVGGGSTFAQPGALVETENAALGWEPIDALSGEKDSGVLRAVGRFRVHRLATGATFGVDRG